MDENIRRLPERNIRKPRAKSKCMLAGGLPAGWDAGLPTFPADEKGIATRDASGKMLNPIAQSIPWLIGGSARSVAVDQDDA